MVQIGTIEYKARVSNVAEAQANAQDFADSNRQMGSSAQEAGAASGFLAGRLSTASDAEEDAAQGGEEADENFTILTGTLFGLGSAFGKVIASFLGFGGVLGTISGGVSTLMTWLSGLTLSGIMGSVTSALSSFAAWLAAGSAGALAVGAAIGLVIGLFGVWILEITGVLDWIGKLGATLRNQLPAWARDGILAVIGFFTGPLAIIGAFIIGTIRGGFDEGFARAIEATNIFIGAFKRSFRRIVLFVKKQMGRAANAFASAWDTAKTKTVGILKNIRKEILSLKNDVLGFFGDIGEAMSFDGGSLGLGKTGGGLLKNVGGLLNLPQAQSGGRVAETGAAVVHKGEQILSPSTTAVMTSGGGGGGGKTVQVDNITIELSGEFDPSNVTRRQLDKLAERMTERIGGKTNRRSGVR